MQETDIPLYTRFTGLKASNTGLQTWISVGGWSMNDADQPTAKTFSQLAASDSAQSAFFKSLLNFMATYGFDGVDMDWEYPVAPERSGVTEDFENYVSFLKNLRNALSSDGHNYGLSITLPSSYWYMQNFDIVNIEPHIDFFNIMTYDLHGTWDSTDPYIGAIVGSHTNLTEIDEAMQLLWRNNIDPAKVNMGLGFYGRSFTLTDPSCSSAGCPFSGGAEPGPCTANSGTLSYAEIQNIIADNDAVTTLDKDAAVMQAVWNDNQWVSYDNEDTFKLKVDYANDRCLGGFLVWASSLDDSSGSAASIFGGVTGVTEKRLAVGDTSISSLSSCVWGECNADCPAGTSPAQSGSGKSKSNTGIFTGCDSGSRNYCCPSNDVPSCTWRGGAPFCNGKCHDGEVEVASDLSGTGSECWTGHKVLCCQQTASDAAAGSCSWHGSAPFCNGKCDDDQTKLTSDAMGAGGEEICLTGSKAFCCSSPVPYTNCDWYGRNGINRYLQLTCTGGCPTGKYPIAVDPSWCDVGYNQYCCDVPTSINDPTLADFNSKLQAWADDPTCAAKTVLKRSSLSASDQLDFFTTLTALFRSGGQSSSQAAELQLYINNLESVLDASPSDFVNYYDAFPGVDPVQLTSQAMCNGASVGDTISDQHNTETDICLLPTDVNSDGCGSLTPKHDEFKKRVVRKSIEIVDIRSLNDTFYNYIQSLKIDVVKRVISASEDGTVLGPGQQPSYAALMTAVINGEMTFQYSRLVQIGDSSAAFDNFRGPTDQQQGILEVAWLMGENNQVGNLNSNYQEFDGTDITVNPPPDSFLVMHFHIDHVLTDESGNPYVGIYAYNAFHGQYVNNQNRVDGNSVNTGQQRNRRTALMQCPGYGGPQGNNRYVYPGYEVNANHIDSVFMNHLYQQGILTRDRVAPIIANSDNTDYGFCEFFDWEAAPTGAGASEDANGNTYVRPNGFK
ncbi:hypothetical protein E8E14_001197 [Neopestalotiopsis sp. 37M]|nr:hypothetical protein E8E14_001197 [Neopestalotiopsis sp. 37M]